MQLEGRPHEAHWLVNYWGGTRGGQGTWVWV